MEAYLSIKSVFDDVGKHVVADHVLFSKVCVMESRFVNKKQEHIEFFGGNLTGVQVVRFTDSDKDYLFSEVVDIDIGELEEKLYSIKFVKGKSGLNRDWKISSDVFNITCTWLIYLFEHSKHLDEEQRHEAKIRVCNYLIYKFLTSLLYNSFRFPADVEVAQATYAQLSNKFALKQFGSWGATIRNLAENGIDSKGIHLQVLHELEDERVIYFLNDIQGRIRDMFKNIYSVFDRLNREGVRIVSTNSVVETDGEMVLKDSTRSPGIYTRYLKTIIADKNTFIKQELVDIIAGIMHTMSPRLLMKTLDWTVDNYQKTQNSDIDKAVDLVLEHAIDYLSVNHSDARKNVAMLIDKLRGAYMSSRSTDIKLLEVRVLVEKIVREATGSLNEAGISSVRTAWMLYIVIRAYSMRFYTNS